MASSLDSGFRDLLKRTSRSFYLSIQVLPRPVRTQVAIGYLLARAADSIADTTLVPAAARRERLLLLREAALGKDGSFVDSFELAGPSDGSTNATAVAERQLLRRLPECLAMLHRLDDEDRELVQRVLSRLIEGMLRDLSRFPTPGQKAVPPDEVVALGTLLDLDEYTYFAAGCVGEFWTDLTAAHLPEVAHLRGDELRSRGVDLGKALQLVNVIRDAPADLLAGRCYWPQDLLATHGLTPRDLAVLVKPGSQEAIAPERRAAVLQVTRCLLRLGRERVERAWPYVEAIPPRALRLRLACVWPLWLCLNTLSAIARAGSPLLAPDGGTGGRTVKIRRQQVYWLVFTSTVAGVLDMARSHSGKGWMAALHARHVADAALGDRETPRVIARADRAEADAASGEPSLSRR